MGRPHDMWSNKEAAATPTGYIVNTRALGILTLFIRLIFRVGFLPIAAKGRAWIFTGWKPALPRSSVHWTLIPLRDDCQ